MKIKNDILRSLIVVLLLLCQFGCQTKLPNSIRIGAIMPMSGSMANYGKTSQAALLAMQSVINHRRDSLKLPKIDLIIEDDHMEVKGGVNAINKLILSDNVVAIIGPDASSITLGVCPIAESHKTVLISPGSTSSDVTKAGDYIFRTILSGEYEGKIASSIYKEHFNSEKLAILYINNEYGISLKENFLKNFSTSDKMVQIPYEEGETNFSSYLTKVKQEGATVIYLIGYNEMIQIYQQSTELNLGVRWLGTAQLGSQSLIDKIGKPAEGTVFPSWELDLAEIKQNHAPFYLEYQRLSGGLELDAFAANAADALAILDHVIDANTSMTSTEIKDALYKVSNFQGITGPFSFDENGDVHKRTRTKVILNGKIADLKE